MRRIKLILFIAGCLIQTSLAQNAAIARDSLNKKTAPVFSISNINLNLYDKFLITSPGSIPKNKTDIASQSELINYERPLPDGTTWRKNAEMKTGRLMLLFGAMAAIDLGAYLYQRQVWYTEPTTVFHTLDFNEDMKKFRHMDKLGHFTDAYFTSDLTSKLYRWAGFSGDGSIWFGALTGWLWMLQIEVSDGFMAGWGFSWGDMLFNTLGSGFFVLQQYNYDLLGGLQPKFTYHYSDAWRDGRYWRDPGGFIEDYEGMTFWLTVNIHHYLPDSWKKGYPEWLAPLGLAVGHAAKNIAGNPYGGYKEIFFGLDVDLRKIPFGDDSGFFRFLKSELNFIRLPLPTIRVSPGGDVWYGLYF